jgi:uncharacterized protein YjbI with pentapeptide repeats
VRQHKNFAKQNLECHSFAGQDLRGANFFDANLADADFTGADLRSAIFRAAQAPRACFRRARLGATFWKRVWLNAVVAGILGPLSAFAILWNAAIVRAAFRPGDQQLRGVLGVLVSCAITVIILRRGPTPKGLLTAAVTALLVATGGAVAAVAAGVGKLSFSDALEIVVADAGVFAVSGAGALSVAGAGVAAGAFAGVVAGLLAGTFSLAVSGTAGGALVGVGIGALTVVRTGSGALATAWQFVFVAYIGWRTAKRDEKYFLAEPIATWIGSLGGTSFRGANLSGATFDHATLSHASFADANISRVCWRGVRDIHKARFGNSILRNRRVERLLLNGRPDTQSYDGIDLRGANLDEPIFRESR